MRVDEKLVFFWTNTYSSYPTHYLLVYSYFSPYPLGFIDPFLGIFVATVFILEVKLKWPVRQFQASLTKLSALLQVVVQLGTISSYS